MIKHSYNTIFSFLQKNNESNLEQGQHQNKNKFPQQTEQNTTEGERCAKHIPFIREKLNVKEIQFLNSCFRHNRLKVAACLSNGPAKKQAEKQ